MENTNSLPKQQAVDGRGAFAGNAEPDPEQVTVDAVAAKAGVELAPGEAADVKEMMEERDKHRWELDPGSARRPNPRA